VVPGDDEVVDLDTLKAELAALNAETDKLPYRPGTRDVGSPGGRWRTLQGRPLRWVLPGETITQYGTSAAGFREQPRFDAQFPMVEMEVSMMLGRVSAQEAARFVTMRPPKPSARARYFNTDDLYRNGYTVLHTPSERIPNHVSVYFGAPFAINDLQKARAQWFSPGRVTLESLHQPEDGIDQ
jgi:hypothetical protein